MKLYYFYIDYNYLNAAETVAAASDDDN